ncbi:imelysin family protein [Salinivibrio sp. ES.052]|uniref:imelysin family protein n=1 Tax=Salinivibrio sp. ES.052 TaxID=1882823 RepID=UPI000928BE2F|nr:imelysin family protein [Salinivibrio sp. ES.052]SIN83784.1 putative iron-regulated protein [Salinivibrio sp. ES.052]
MEFTPFNRNLIALSLFAAPFSVNAATQQEVVEHYADIAHAVFADSHATAVTLDNTIEAFTANPSQKTFQAAKKAWLDARVPYQQSEVFRFGNAIVDDWEGQLNAWPLDEGLIDYVAGGYQAELGNAGATANIVANQSIQIGATDLDVADITPKLLASLNEVGGSEANVASGYHAIEFLLWGQDLNGTNPGAGERPYSDFAYEEDCTNGHCDRRRAYLKAAADLLVDDLAWMRDQWAEGNKDNYRASLLADSSKNGLRKMLFGMGSLSLGELAGERMKVALEANSTEDEHDCFSDNTHNSHFYNEQGIYNVMMGTYQRVDGSKLTGPSVLDLVKGQDTDAANAIKTSFEQAREQVKTLVVSAEEDNVHFDQLIAASNTEGNQLVNESIAALVDQTKHIEKAAQIIGIDNLNPDTADHQF